MVESVIILTNTEKIISSKTGNSLVNTFSGW